MNEGLLWLWRWHGGYWGNFSVRYNGDGTLCGTPGLGFCMSHNLTRRTFSNTSKSEHLFCFSARSHKVEEYFP